MRRNSTPIQDGFMMPFEGDLHQGTIILVPYRKDTWRENANPASDAYLELVKIISKYECVYLGISPKVSSEVKTKFLNLPNVHILDVNYDDAWARDNTLIFVKKGNEIRAVDFRFNAWGGSVDGLYEAYQDDDKLGKSLVDYFDMDYYYLDKFILEGGSVHTDGCGTLITTKACLLSKGRNSDLTISQIEEHLKKYLGIKKIIWLDNGIVNDETNEHVDNMACFVRQGLVMLATCKDQNDLQYQYSKKAYEVLINSTDALGRKLEVVTINVPTDIKMTLDEASGLEINDFSKKRLAGERLAASYVNYYQSNQFVIVPKFNHELDKEALELFKKLYPDKAVYQLDSKEILLGGGNIHCITMQIPKGDIK